MSYFASVRTPRYSLLFALPLLLAYEALAWVLGRSGQVGVRNGADVLLKSLFLTLGGRHGLALFTLVVLGGGVVLVVRDLRRRGAPRLAVYGGMLAESVVYGLLLGTVAGLLTSFLLTGPLALATGGAGEELGLPTQLMISLGAGIYEELLFRVLVVAGLALQIGRAHV